MFENGPAFKFSRTPYIIFGPGKFGCLTELPPVKNARRVILVIGSKSFENAPQYVWLTNELKQLRIEALSVRVAGEPSPDIVDRAVSEYRDLKIDTVIAIGGGSVIDAGKAISAMILKNEPVITYLEGVGTGKIHDGIKIPFIAVPTTAGTGSEATKNAVLGQVGSNGFKNSLRHENFIPDIALVDPELTLTCPSKVTASSGMDALCQLIGSYMSTSASPLTDALALSGIEAARDSLIDVSIYDSGNIDKRTKMSYAALVSGITLANAGLCTDHGFASSIGALFKIPHGIICGTILPETVRMSINELMANKNNNEYHLKKYSRLGEILTGTCSKNIEKVCDALVEYLKNLKGALGLPGLGEFGVTEKDAEPIALKTSNKNNPVQLSTEALKQIVVNSL
ncbi:MAG TPA: alcohol dehydrogenase [Ruminiclostridium sp.]|jgi:alcohol dehydrogenase class IV|nr:iron-containing alcohol dehydrogenase [Clostridiaceae bacterium]HAA24741.1 alcohol dehydrogenase [Ruminiclostridium sp.]